MHLSEVKEETAKPARDTSRGVCAVPMAGAAITLALNMTSAKQADNKKTARRRFVVRQRKEDLALYVLANQAGHLEHRDLGFAEDFFQLCISVDHALVDFVLQVVFLDVHP
jgi:hypothetical protein